MFLPQAGEAVLGQNKQENMQELTPSVQDLNVNASFGSSGNK